MLTRGTLIQLINESESSGSQLFFHCSICNVSFAERNQWLSHIKRNVHDCITSTEATYDNFLYRSTFQQLLLDTSSVLRDQIEFIIQDKIPNVYSFKCTLCDLSIKSYFALCEHLENETHQKKVTNYNSQEKNVQKLETCHHSIMETFAIPENFDDSIQYLMRYFKGSLNCRSCGKKIPINIPSIKNHFNSCVSLKLNSDLSKEIGNQSEKFVKSSNVENVDVLEGNHKNENLNDLYYAQNTISLFPQLKNQTKTKLETENNKKYTQAKNEVPSVDSQLEHADLKISVDDEELNFDVNESDASIEIKNFPKKKNREKPTPQKKNPFPVVTNECGVFEQQMLMDRACEIGIKEFLQTLFKKYGSVRKMKSFCLFCQRYFSSTKSWTTHLRSSEHAFVMETVRSGLDYYCVFCYLCKSLNFGTKKILLFHVKSKYHKNAVMKMDSSPVTLQDHNSSTGEDEQELGNANVDNKCLNASQSYEKEAGDLEIEEKYTKEKEGKQELAEESLDEQEELYDILMEGENSIDKSASDDEPEETPSVEKNKQNESEGKMTKAAEEKSKNVEYAIIVRGIPKMVIKNKTAMREIFRKYVNFDRSFTRKNEPGSLYLIMSKEPEKSFQIMKQHLNELKQKFGTEDLSVDYNATKNEGCGIREKLSTKAINLFSNIVDLKIEVQHLIKTYETESNDTESQNRIKTIQNDICNFAKFIFNRHSSDMKTHVFGSRVTGLANNKSDVDIYLQIGPTFRGLVHNNVQLQQQLVILFSKQMRYYPSHYGNICSIPFARVPIVKFTHRPSKLNCDLSFKSGLSTMNSILVRTYLELDQRIKWLICALKIWMKTNDLADRNLFTTYAQIWMVLFFLMQPDIALVPTVLSLQYMLPDEQRESITVEDWNCSFPDETKMVWRSKCTLSAEQLLKRLFEFYSNVTLENYVLCTLTGLKIEKKHFVQYYEGLPTIFNSYKKKVTEDPALFRKIINDFDGLCVQDPFDHCHNLTKPVNSKKFLAFVDLCSQTIKLFKDIY